MIKNKLSWKNIILFAGVYLAFAIGSGFATGQEILQYFASYGSYGILGACVLFAALAYVAGTFITLGQREQFTHVNDVYLYYCGPRLGRIYDMFSVFLLYASFSVMVSGAGATLEQNYGISATLGATVVGICVILTVLCGLRRIVILLGCIGPFKIIFVIVVASFGIAQGPFSLQDANQLITNLHILQPASSWFTATVLYVGLCLVWLAAFLTTVGKDANSQLEAGLAGVLGALGFSLAVLLLTIALLMNIEQLSGTMIPTLALAGNIHHLMSTIFSVLIIVGIYTATVPLLWTTAARFSREGTLKFRILTLVLGLLGVMVGLLFPFNALINTIYVINGYAGIILLIIMLYKDARKLLNRI